MTSASTIGAIAAVTGAGAAVYSAASSASAARDQAAAQQQALNQATTRLNPFQVSGFGGMGAGYGMLPPGSTAAAPAASTQQVWGADGGLSNYGNYDWSNWLNGLSGLTNPSAAAPGVAGNSVNLSAGDLEGVRSALSHYATGTVPGTVNNLPPGVLAALGNMQGQGAILPGDNLGGVNLLAGGALGQYGNAYSGLQQAFGGFQNNLQSTAFRGAADQFAQAGAGFNGVYDQTLANLRAQAQPFEQRALDSLQNSQFGTGQLGTSGGALQTEAFARGLGQTDLARQLEATNQTRLTQQNALSLGQGLAGVGGQVAGLGDTLLNSAFNRYGALSGQLAGYNETAYSRMGQLNQLAYGRSQDTLAAQTAAAGLPAQLQGAQLQNVLAALQGQSGIQQSALQLFGAGLSAEQAAANARIGAGSNLGNIVTNPNFGSAGYGTAAAFGQLAQSLSPQGGSLNALANLFQPVQQYQPTAGQFLGNQLNYFVPTAQKV